VLRYLLDTNVCIRVLRDRPQSARQRFRAEAPHLCISSVVLHELHFGAARSDDPARAAEALDRFASQLAVLPFDSDAAAHAADIRAFLEAAGQRIGPFDTLIAGHARSRGLIVVTGNLREFQRVPGLRCEDWLND
jgi:tRNA(fMet)-specific endonuclease VapC